MMLSLPPLQIPTHNAHAHRRSSSVSATNTLHITHPSRTFFSPRSLSHLKSTITPLAPNGILSFSPLKSLRRVIIVFNTPADARAVRDVLDGAYNLPSTSEGRNSLDVEGDTIMNLSSGSESSCGEEMDCEVSAPIRCYYGNETTIVKEKKMLKPEARQKREFEGELAPHEEGAEEKIPATTVRKRSSSLVLLESDGRKPSIEVEEF